MNAYSTLRNSAFATVLVATLASIVSSALAADQKIVYARELPGRAAIAALPEVTVTASRLDG